MNIKFSLDGYGISTPSAEWPYLINSNVTRNRLYYICEEGASYHYRGVQKPFIKGHLYIIPAAMGVKFSLEKETFRHVYVDYVDVSGVIFSNVVEIDVKEYPFIEYQLESLRCFMEIYVPNGANKFPGSTRTLFYKYQSRIITACTTIFYDVVEITPYVVNIPHTISRCLEYISKNYINNITIEELAQMSGMSQSYFTKLFRKYTGKTPHNYLKDFRLDVAVNLLREEIPISEVAELVGFQYNSSFTAVFKKKYGCSPKRFLEDIMKVNSI